MAFAGLLFMRAYLLWETAEEDPAGFDPVQPDLKDVYFSAMAGHYHQGTAKGVGK